MKTVVSNGAFHDAFHHAGRADQFTYSGKCALYQYLTEYEQETDSEIELDVIALCCDYTEYNDIEDFQADYGESYESLEDIEKQTTVIRCPGGSFIIQDF